MGFRGMSCDVNEAEHKSCDTESTNKYGRNECDCVVADEMSIFAGEQCRKPYTEYGASLQQTIGGHISFCTNGGKLKGDMMAAKVSPGNTTNNYLFQWVLIRFRHFVTFPNTKWNPLTAFAINHADTLAVFVHLNLLENTANFLTMKVLTQQLTNEQTTIPNKVEASVHFLLSWFALDLFVLS